MTTLTVIGDKLGLIIEQDLLEQLGIDEATPIEVTSDQEGIYIRPVRFATSAEVEKAAIAIMATHAETLTRLAE